MPSRLSETDVLATAQQDQDDQEWLEELHTRHHAAHTVEAHPDCRRCRADRTHYEALQREKELEQSRLQHEHLVQELLHHWETDTQASSTKAEAALEWLTTLPPAAEAALRAGSIVLESEEFRTLQATFLADYPREMWPTLVHEALVGPARTDFGRAMELLCTSQANDESEPSPSP